jgi:RimJ/RimL family protein N-acetyltransferase
MKEERMQHLAPQTAAPDLILRDIVDDDLPTFFVQQLDPDANRMAAFTAKDPSNHDMFTAHWNRIRRDPSVVIKTIVVAGEIAGYVSSYEEDGQPEVTYWLGKAYWGQGIATRALAAFLETANTTRPIHARVAQDNRASLRVLQKCGFVVKGEAVGFANARGHDVSEYLLTLDTI